MPRSIASFAGSLRAALLGCALALLGACRAQPGTAVFLEADFSLVAGADQLRVSGQTEEGTVFDPSVLPDPARGPLTGVQSVRVLLVDGWAGHHVRLLAEALAQGEVVGQGTAAVDIVRGAEVTGHLVLLPLSGCLGCAGCCANGTCVTGQDPAACGQGGGTCARCDATADSCVGGSCTCGTGPACGVGQRCDQGRCICDASSCASGCCDGARCVAGTTPASCGHSGAVCGTCDPVRADGCADGTCGCGAGPACGVGQRCEAGACVCDPATCAGCCLGDSCRPGTESGACGTGGITCDPCSACTVDGHCASCTSASCPSGCCSGSLCVAPTPGACGTGGASCTACTGTSNTCSGAGSCGCGAGPACGAGARCEGGACVCDAASCPDGCCQGGSCVRTRSAEACGASGGACQGCDPVAADTCTAGGQCACGAGAPCGAGQRCSAGACVCDASSCSGGCCVGSTCRTAFDLSHCPTGQSSCGSCSSTLADGCNGGGCSCGTGPACVPGQQCVGGLCVCNKTSCNSGCCSGTTCLPGDAVDACGAGGTACRVCTPKACRSQQCK